MKPNFRAMINSILHLRTFEEKAEELVKALDFAFECGKKCKEKELKEKKK